jgi:hypothetical protein
MEDRKGADRVAALKNSGSRIYNWAHAWLGYKYSEDERPLETSIDIDLDPTLNNSTLVLHQQINEMSTLFQTLTDNIGRMKDELNTLDQNATFHKLEIIQLRLDIRRSSNVKMALGRAMRKWATGWLLMIVLYICIA